MNAFAIFAGLLCATYLLFSIALDVVRRWRVTRPGAADRVLRDLAVARSALERAEAELHARLEGRSWRQ